MPNRTAKLLSAIFAGFLASVPLTTIAHSETPAADDCLSAPKDSAPQGSHWYYRIDHATNRHCWHLDAAHEKLSQLAPPNSAAAAKPAAPNSEAALQHSVADARAELPGQLRSAGPNQDDAQTPATTANASPGDDNGGAKMLDAEVPGSTVASRWPDASSVSSSSSPGPAAGNPGAPMPSNATAAPPPAIAEVTLAAADSSSEKQSNSVRMLAVAIVGALSLAGVMVSAIFRLAGTRRTGRRRMAGDRRAIWDSPRNVRGSPSLYPSPDAPRPQAPNDDPSERIAEMLTQLSRSTPR
jgi:hypothetical protein